VPEDAAIAARNQMGLHARSPQWIELGRGLNREHIDERGLRIGHMTDETTNRGLWRQYRKMMSE
jgi:fatty-acyl-CoA synthase